MFGYEPLLDGAGQRVDMLCVDFVGRRFVRLKLGALAAMGLVCFAVMTGAALGSLRWARGIFRPLEPMEATTARVDAGELLGPSDATVGAELRMVDQQIERIRLIVTRLLQFAAHRLCRVRALRP